MTDADRAGRRPPQPRMTRGRVALCASTPADCAFVSDVESHPENATFVGQWPPERHMDCMSSNRQGDTYRSMFILSMLETEYRATRNGRRNHES